MLLDRQGRCLTVNNPGISMMCSAQEGLLGSAFRDLWPKELHPLADRSLAKALEGRQVNFDCWRMNGPAKGWWRVTMNPILDSQGRVDRVVAISSEITEQKLAEDAIRESEENLRITLDSIGDAVIATDADGRVFRMNKVAETLCGLSAANAAGKDLSDVFRLKDAVSGTSRESPAVTVLTTGEKLDLKSETLLVSLAGEERLISDSAAPIRNSEGDIVGTVIVFRDITEQSRVEEQLRQSQKMDSLGQLAGGIAHDFNNMLSGTLGYAELIARRHPGDEKTQAYTDIVMKTSMQAADLTRKLLSFSRKEKEESLPFDLHDNLTDALAILERTVDKRITIEKRMHALSSIVIGDPSQIQNAILNVCVNARDAMPEGGKLTIATENIELGESYCRTSPFELEPGQFILVSISDTGTGMSYEVSKRIFEPFFTSKEAGEGTGLGLAAAYGAVASHNGSIIVLSEEGQGTSFHIHLPIDRKSAAQNPAFREEPKEGSGCILIVDDEDAVRSALSLQLEQLGYEVILASDGREGCELYRLNRERVDAVIMDMIMPRMNGRDCLREIRRIDPSAKVIVFSGFVQESILHELQEAGISEFIKKPFRIIQITNALERALQSSS
jgi:PAS domain S-box-containing protein